MPGNPRVTRAAAVILAGGLATRMGGADKCLLPLGEARIIDEILRRLPADMPVALNANGDPARFADLNIPVLPDSVDGFLGPLAGILAGMRWAAGQGASDLVSLAGDTPFFPPDLARRLAAARSDPGQIVIAASRDPDGRLVRQPVFGLWPLALADDLEQALKNGMRKIILWAETHPLVLAEIGPSDLFFNINAPGDLARAAEMAEQTQ